MNMKTIEEYKDFLTELRIRVETVNLAHRHFCRIEQSCDEASRLPCVDIRESHFSGFTNEQEQEAFSKLVEEIAKLNVLASVVGVKFFEVNEE